MINEIDIQWKITSLDCYSNYNNKSNYIFNVHWDCLSYYSGISGGPYYGRAYEVTKLLETSGEFIPYTGLDESTILSWVWHTLGDKKNYFEEKAANEIYDQLSPKILTLPLPWKANLP